MDYPDNDSKHNKNVDGYKVPGDGNAPNHRDAEAGNESFDENPSSVEPHAPADVLGQIYNRDEKAFHDSSLDDFVHTVSKVHHADESKPNNETKK